MSFLFGHFLQYFIFASVYYYSAVQNSDITINFQQVVSEPLVIVQEALINIERIEAKNSKMVSLNDISYHIWRNKMKDLLFVMKLHLLVFATTKPNGKTDEEWAFEHEQVCGFIQ